MAPKRISTAELAWKAIQEFSFLGYDLDELRKKHPGDRQLELIRERHREVCERLTGLAYGKRDVKRVIEARLKKVLKKINRKARPAKARTARAARTPKPAAVISTPAPEPGRRLFDIETGQVRCAECGVDRDWGVVVCAVCHSTKIGGT